MQDPYYRENEYEARELLAKDYVFETDFCISEEQLKWIFCSRDYPSDFCNRKGWHY